MSYDRFGTSKGVEFAKSNNSKECINFHYWFFNRGFEFENSVCNVCHDLKMFCTNLSDIVIVTVKSVDYCIIYGISKSNSFVRKFCTWRSWVYIKMHINKISIKHY